MLAWSVTAILQAAGGVAALRRDLARAGQDVPDRSVIAMWRARNRLPTQWSAPILHVLTQTTPQLVLRDLMVDVTDVTSKIIDPDDSDPFDDDVDDDAPTPQGPIS
jgi:hypothetical protein